MGRRERRTPWATTVAIASREALVTLRVGLPLVFAWTWAMASVQAQSGDGLPANLPAVSQSGIAPEAAGILEKHCVVCHGEKARKAGLDLRNLSDMLRGGESGEPAIIPGKAGESRLIALVASREMPPGKRAKLTEAELEVLRHWVDMVAAVPSGADSRGTQPAISAEKVASEVSDLLDFKCWDCHGRGLRKAGLDLRTAAAAIRGGNSGPAVIPGRGSSSLLLRKIRDDQMPTRQGRDELSIKPVTPKEIELLENWINLGAPEFPARPVLSNDARRLTAEDRDWWSFRPPVRPSLPPVRAVEEVRTPIDAFLLARLEMAGLGFAPEADRRTLIRRLSVDLIGLTPTLAEVRDFEQDQRPDAYERLVDRLLASPRYGERWGQQWLDAAGYSESDGGDGFDPVRHEFHRYRDYVIRSLNANKPYDRFITEQLAGDELADYQHKPRMTAELADNLIATGFLRTTVDPTDRPVHNFLPDRYQVLADTVGVVSSTLMGLTIGCARCHSHKYDPISHVEYYQFSAIFGAAYAPSTWKRPKDRLLPLATQAERLASQVHSDALDRQLKPLKAQRVSLLATYRARRLKQKLSALPAPIQTEIEAAMAIPENKRTAGQKALLASQSSAIEVKDGELPTAFPEYRWAISALNARITRLEAAKKILPVARALTDIGTQASPFYFLRRGEAHLRGDVVLPGVPAVLEEATESAGELKAAPPSTDAATSGRRLAFARWLTRPENPLTARVLVNRVWQGHLGTGLVATPENFGRTGAKSTHPELLDWLAIEFREQGWNLKSLHRLIVSSRVYRQASHRTAEGMAADPLNTLWWRVPLRRIDAEVIRDSVMATAGGLNQRMYGPASEVLADPEGQVETKPAFEHARRSVYMLHQRSKPLTVLDVFDSPRMTTNCLQRRTSTVATQALLMLNSAWISDQCERLIDQIHCDDAPSAEQVSALVRCILAREPTALELSKFAGFVREQAETYREQGALAPEVAARRALADLALALFNAPDFLYVD